MLFAGVPLCRLRRDELRQATAYGFERPVLLGETVADASAFGARGRAARADVFIRHMPAGCASGVAETPVSGGKAQRIGPARAFFQARRVPVLDVAASLDTVAPLGAVVTSSPTPSRSGWRRSGYAPRSSW